MCISVLGLLLLHGGERRQGGGAGRSDQGRAGGDEQDLRIKSEYQKHSNQGLPGGDPQNLNTKSLERERLINSMKEQQKCSMVVF